MATIVLTAVGAALGGPIGAAIGSLAGQAIDRELLFKPKGRQGPRLAELAVQTSTYGAPIPQLFGTMRVAGQVIWATDLKEGRSRQGGGKGQPSTTTYSYSASFAVLLSARPILRVRRIWADGKLLRGLAGDWKTRTGFRLRLGHEDQVADPLIAAAEGVGGAPAMRGQAYAVFEDLALADFGNRIPSLTFEVEADAAPVPVGAIVRSLAGGRIASTVALPLAGYAAHGDSLAGAIAALAEASGAAIQDVADALHFEEARANAPMPLIDAGAAIAGQRVGRAESIVAGIEALPRRVTLTHYDPARDYQIGTQAATRSGQGTRERRVELPAAIDAGAAKRAAAALLARAIAARATRTMRLPWSPELPDVGAAVTIVGSAGSWRVRAITLERMVAELDLVRVAAGTLPAATASPGRVLAEPDLAAGATRIEAFELWPLGDVAEARPLLAVAACGAGPGWRGAELLVRRGEEAWTEIGRARVPAVIGRLAEVLAPASPALVDRAGVMLVELEHAGMALADADAGALAAGVNLAMVGDELLQFARAEPLGAARWRLTDLRRGCRGSEAVVAEHPSGARFVLIEADALVLHPLPADAIGTTLDVMASGVGDDGEAGNARAMIDGRSVAPPAPVHPAVAHDADGGLTIRWVRRSRIGWGWRDGVDAPLGEIAEHYQLTITRGDGVVRSVECEGAAWRYAPAPLAADRAAGPIAIAIRQRGDLALSHPLGITI